MVEQLTRMTPQSALRTLGDSLKKAADTTIFVAQNAAVIAEWAVHEMRSAEPSQAAVNPRKRR